MKGYETEEFKEVQKFFKTKGHSIYADMVEEDSNYFGKYVMNWDYDVTSGVVVIVFNNYDIDIYHIGKGEKDE